jgi:hypothetical protein
MGRALQDRIRERAYQLWEQDGRPSGRDREHWARAEAELGVAPPALPAAPVPAPPSPAPPPAARAGGRLLPAAIAAGFVLLLAGIVAYATVARLAAREALELERFKVAGQLALDQRRLQAQLLLEAGRAGDPQKTAQNLQFLIAAGLLDDPDHRIAALAGAGRAPVFAAPAAPSAPEDGLENSRRITENGSDFLVSSRASPAGERTTFTYRVTNNGARDETVDWGDILHATIAPGRTASVVTSAAGRARSAPTFFQWGPTAKTLVYAYLPDAGGAASPAPPAP